MISALNFLIGCFHWVVFVRAPDNVTIKPNIKLLNRSYTYVIVGGGASYLPVRGTRRCLTHCLESTGSVTSLHLNNTLDALEVVLQTANKSLS